MVEDVRWARNCGGTPLFGWLVLQALIADASTLRVGGLGELDGVVKSRSPARVISDVYGAIEYVHHHDLRSLVDSLTMSLELLRHVLARTPSQGHAAKEPLERVASVSNALRNTLLRGYPMDGSPSQQLVTVSLAVHIADMASELWPRPRVDIVGMDHLYVKVAEVEVAIALTLCFAALREVWPPSRDESGRQVDVQLRLIAETSQNRVDIRISGPTQLSSTERLSLAGSSSFKCLRHLLGTSNDCVVSVTEDGLNVSCVAHPSSNARDSVGDVR